MMIGLVHSSGQEKKAPTTNSSSSLGKVDHNCKYHWLQFFLSLFNPFHFFIFLNF